MSIGGQTLNLGDILCILGSYFGMLFLVVGYVMAAFIFVVAARI
jgi:hypothetical protein